MIVNTEVFRNELSKILMNAKENNKDFVEVISGDLHRQVGEYPGRNHKMPTCCNVMKSMMKSNDEIISEPPKGKGATLKIKYFIE
jgi:hypothetical protein